MKNNPEPETSLMVHWLKRCTSKAKGMGSIPDREIKIPNAAGQLSSHTTSYRTLALLEPMLHNQREAPNTKLRSDSNQEQDKKTINTFKKNPELIFTIYWFPNKFDKTHEFP